jgi:hypothetical protein
MNRAIAAEALGELVPLAAGAEAEDDPVDRPPPVDARPPAAGLGRGRAIFQEDRLDPPPEFVVDLPDGFEGLGGCPSPSQVRLSRCRRVYTMNTILETDWF